MANIIVLDNLSQDGLDRLDSARSIDYEVRRRLVQKGHRVQVNVGSFGGYQAVMFDRVNGVYFGASESRKDGQAAGY